MASEKTLLRRELVAAHVTIFERDNRIVELGGQAASEKAEKESYRAQLASANAKLALYEGPNAPSSTKSQFNARRSSFRKKRGSRGSDGSGSDMPGRRGIAEQSLRSTKQVRPIVETWRNPRRIP